MSTPYARYHSITGEYHPAQAACYLGLVLLTTDLSSEQMFASMLRGAEIDFFTNRVKFDNPVTMENLAKMQDDLPRAAAGVASGQPLDALIYGCTSGTVAIGEQRVADLVGQAHPGVPVTNPVTGAIAALEHLNCRRITLLAPYLEESCMALAETFGQRGLDIRQVYGLDIASDIDMAKVPADFIFKSAVESVEPGADALFISCTALRAPLVIDAIEKAIGRPVITSHQAMLWHALQLAGKSVNISGFGRLLSA